MSLTRATANVITNPLLFTGSLTIGTSDASGLNLQTGGVTRLSISSAGNLSGAHIQNLGTTDDPVFHGIPLAGSATYISFNSTTRKIVGDSGLLQLINGGTLLVLGSSGNVGIGTTTPSQKLDVNGSANINNNLTVLGNVVVSQHLAAATKSFVIPNQATGGKLQYGCVESPQHDVYVRGKTSSSKIDLPPEWSWLVDPDSITVSLTPVGKPFTPYLMNADNLQVVVGGVEGEYCYVIYGERKDVEKLVVNIESEEVL